MATSNAAEITTVEQLKVELQKYYDPQVIQTNLDVVREALDTSKLQDGLGVPVMSYSPSSLDRVSYETPRPILNTNTGGIYTRAEHDPVKIFEILYDIKQRELQKRKEEYDQLVRDAERAWWLFEQKYSATDRYSAHLGKIITKEYFLENLYKCPYDLTGRCIVRYKRPEDARPHYHA
jgi:hypothetical protein